MLLVVAMVGMTTAMLVYGMIDTTSAALQRDRETAAAFAEVKRALIGWSVSRDPSIHGANARPGEFPCPDMNNDGFEDGSCAAGALGRVPWKTLGIPEPKDAAGETLWYTVAGPFRIWNMNNTTIDNDTKGNVTVYQDSTAVTITTQAVAVIFAPGALMGAQNRNSAAAALCPTTGTTIAYNLCAANYLETAAGVNNATTNGPFISAPASDTFNDKAMVITTADLVPVVEQRVGREMLALLSAYRVNSACACYPWAANDFDDDSVTGRRRGGVPMEVALPEAWGSGTIPSVPSWIAGASPNNKWGGLFYYAVAPGVVETPTAGALTVDGASKDVVLITTGPAGASRPSSNLGDYVEDLENRNNDDIFCRPGASAMAPCTPTAAYARDRLYTLP